MHSEMDTSTSSNFHPDVFQVPACTTGTVSMNSAQASEYEDAESGAFIVLKFVDAFLFWRM